MTSLQLGGYDPLDAQLDDVAIAPPRPGGRPPSRVPLAGWSASSVPVASLLLVGMILGPRGISVLPPGVLSLLDPAIPVALAALGALVGLSIDVRGRRGRRDGRGEPPRVGTRRAARRGAARARGAVSVGPRNIPLWIIAGSLGVCAASSLAVPASRRTSRGRPRGTARARRPSPDSGGWAPSRAVSSRRSVAALALVGQAIVIAVLLSGRRMAPARSGGVGHRAARVRVRRDVADWRSRGLPVAVRALERARGRNLLAGSPAVRHASRCVAMCSTFSIRCSCWCSSWPAHEPTSRWPRPARGRLCRSANGGKASWGCMAARIGRRRRAADAADSRLLSPGVFGVALALNIVRAAGPDATVLLTIVVLGTIGSEIIAELARTRNVGASERDACR